LKIRTDSLNGTCSLGYKLSIAGIGNGPCKLKMMGTLYSCCNAEGNFYSGTRMSVSFKAIMFAGGQLRIGLQKCIICNVCHEHTDDFASGDVY
jgi:hypothetical protein